MKRRETGGNRGADRIFRVGALSRACRTAFPLAVLCLLVFSCFKKPTDWKAWNDQTIEGSLDTLRVASDLYGRIATISGKSVAADSTVQYLLAQPCVECAGVSPDSSAWVDFMNGLPGIIFEPQTDTGTELRRPPSQAFPPSFSVQGGEVQVEAGVFSPFRHYRDRGSLEPGSYVAAKLGDCGLTVHWLSDDNVCVDTVKAYLEKSLGVFFWTGHGVFRPVRKDGTYGYVLAIGEWAGTLDAAKALIHAYEERYHLTGDDFDITWWFSRDERRYYLCITPTFVGRFADFDQNEGNPPTLGYQYVKSIAYINSCNSANVLAASMIAAFRDNGVDAYFGWDGDEAFGTDCPAACSVFRMLSDTFTTGQVLSALPENLRTCPIYHGTLQMGGDGDVMVRSYFAMDVDGQRVRHPIVSSFFIFVGTEVTGLTTGAAVAETDVLFPGTAPGSWDVHTQEGTWLMYVRPDRGYIALCDFVGTSGQINVTRSDENFVAGTFSGVLGSWDPGHDTGNVPPDYTVNLTNGVFKHAKGVVVSGVGGPGHQLTPLAERRFLPLSPDDAARSRQKPQ